MSENNGTKRFEAKLEPELYARFAKAFDHGIRQRVVSSLIEIAVSSIEAAKHDGNDAVIFGAILSGQLRFVYHSTVKQTLSQSEKENGKT